MKYFIFSFLFIYVGCQSKTASEAVGPYNIDHVESREERKAFLQQIRDDDQGVRGEEGAELMIKYGKESKEHKDYIKKQHDQDAINLSKIEAYFEKFDHPRVTDVGSLASVPYLVIHHAQGYDVRERHFTKIYKAYKEGNISDTSMSFYLGRMHQMKFNERFVIEGPFRSDDEINQLIKLLGLENQQKLVLNRLPNR